MSTWLDNVNKKIDYAQMKTLESDMQARTKKRVHDGSITEKITYAFRIAKIETYADLFRYVQKRRGDRDTPFEKIVEDNMVKLGTTAAKLLAEHLKRKKLYNRFKKSI
jgi:hypothetical protein